MQTSHIIICIIVILIIFYIIYLIFKSKSDPIPIQISTPVNTPISITPTTPTTQTTPTTPTPQPKPTISKSKPDFIFYNFSDPNCPYSKQFKPVWDQLSAYFASVPNIDLKYIDTTLPENENITFYYNISQSPTIILVSPSRHEEYEGHRQFELLKNFVINRINQSQS